MTNVDGQMRKFKQVVVGGIPNHKHHWLCDNPNHDGISIIRCKCGATAKNIGNFDAFYSDSQQAVMGSLKSHSYPVLPF